MLPTAPLAAPPALSPEWRLAGPRAAAIAAPRADTGEPRGVPVPHARPLSDERLLSRLGLIGTGYALLLALLATLAPFRFARPERFAFDLSLSQSDVALNLLLLLPLGFFYALSARGRGTRALSALAGGAALSLSIELAQMFLPERRASPWDMTANAASAWAGARLYELLAPWLDRWLLSRLRARRPVANLPVLLLPLLWLDGMTAHPLSHALLALPLGLAGASALSAGAPARWPARASRSARACAWFALGLLPALLTAPAWVALALPCLALATPWLERRGRGELAALRQALGLLLVYLLASVLLPWSFGHRFHFTVGFMTFDSYCCPMMLAFLARYAAFTLLGYLLAERAAHIPSAHAPGLGRVGLQASLLALLLELAQGCSPAHGASVLAFVLLSLAAIGGALLHRAQQALAAPAAVLGATAQPACR